MKPLALHVRGWVTTVAALAAVWLVVANLPIHRTIVVTTAGAPVTTPATDPSAPAAIAEPTEEEAAPPAESQREQAPEAPATPVAQPATSATAGSEDGGRNQGGEQGGSGGDGDVADPPPPTTTTTTTAATPPTTEPPPPPPPPPPPLRFGLNTFTDYALTGQTAEDTVRAVLDLSPDAMLRFTVAWQGVQLGRRSSGDPCQVTDSPLHCVTPGPIDWRALDADLAPLHAAGIGVLLTPISAPPWARAFLDVPVLNRDRQLVVPPADEPQQLAQWRAFNAALVQHVEERFPGLLAGIEVWNEPNGVHFWTVAGGPDPARYARLLCAAYDGVKSVDPSMPVLFGGTNPERFDIPGVKLSVPTFIGTAYAAGAGACLDSIGVHPYPTDDYHDPIGSFLKAMDDARNAAASRGDAGRTLSITEVNSLPDQSDELMASFLPEAYRIASEMPDVDMFIVHTLYDDGTRTELGICAAPGSPNPAATAMKQALTGSTEPARC